MQGLQRNVIGMAFCCKKGGGQKKENCHRQSYTHCLVLPYHGPNVIGLWWPVLISGLKYAQC
ncbi:hypothetical protein AADE73_001298 [Escherichia coli]|uniref:hypothetical protein n=1 Tax=Escherichia coli TaxID=562 RepID=UPI00041BB45D|nr:hypothetical protein [Escherichia coli]EEC8179582.1 hypothetical protein [Escherichia coli]EER2570431.1 hypothetical protein [Escherichia coli]EER8919115.1 hypothetical protein [Escherichia coli]EER8986064.1 hypothetical protein [Escherichia coli]EET7492470.1 hypothetical protein [Escherichia coli]